jgi:flagellar motor switch/type III secretory pathway protein FliN
VVFVARRDAGILKGGERLGLRERVLVPHTVGLTLRVNGRVVAIGLLVTVSEVERVRVGDRERVTLTDVDFVARRDAGILKGGERLGLRERVLVPHTVGVTLRVNGRVVAIGVLVTVSEAERVILVDRVRVTDTEVVFVGRRDPATVNGGDRLGLIERVLVLDTVGVTLRVNGRVVAIGVLVTVSVAERVVRRDAGILNGGERVVLMERVLLPHIVGVTLRVNGRVVAIGDLVTVTELERVLVPEGERVTDTEVVFVGRRDPAMLNGGDRVVLMERVLLPQIVGVTLRVNGRVVAIGDLVTVSEVERVRDVDRERVTDTEVVFVVRRDPGIVNGGERVGLRERVLVAHTVGVRLRVNGQLVARGVLLTVPVIDWLTVAVGKRDTVGDGKRDTVPEVVRVGRRDAGIVNGGERLGLSERVLVAQTVGVTLRLYCCVVARGV